MKWEFIFNTTVGDKWWGHIEKARQAASDCGYQFFSWNGWIYHITAGKTETKTEDCI